MKLCAAAAVLSACQSRDIEKGRVCLGLGDYALARTFFAKVVEEYPEGYPGRYGLGQALLQQSLAEGDSASFAHAMVQFEACRSIRPSQDLTELLTDAYTERARGLLNRKDTVSALATLAKAIERNPANPQPVNLVGIIYGKLGDPAKAAALFGKALDLDSADASAHFNLGMIRWQAGEYAKAHEHWLKALKALPKDEDVLYWFALSEKRLRESP